MDQYIFVHFYLTKKKKEKKERHTNNYNASILMKNSKLVLFENKTIPLSKSLGNINCSFSLVTSNSSIRYYLRHFLF